MVEDLRPGRKPTGDRTDAASMIAELWQEREQSGPEPAAAPASVRGPDRPKADRPPKSRPDRPKADGTQRALATVAAVLFLGGALAVVAVSQGVIGAPSKATFVAEADAICGTGNGAVAAIPKPTSYPELATAASTLLSTTEVQLGQLRKLTLPGPADRGGAKAVLDAMKETGVAGRHLRDAAGASDAAMTGVAVRGITLNSKDAAAKAGDYGFSACAAGMQPGVDTVVAGSSGVLKAAFLAKADVICTAAASAVKAVRNRRSTSRT